MERKVVRPLYITQDFLMSENPFETAPGSDAEQKFIATEKTEQELSEERKKEAERKVAERIRKPQESGRETGR